MTGLEGHRSAARRSAGACRACGGHGLELVLDLGAQPPAERLVRPEEADRPDAVFPLQILLCPTCFLVQLNGEPIESDSEPGGLALSVSPTMRTHIRGFVDDALRRTNSTAHLRVVEMASHANHLHELLAVTGVASLLIEPVPRYAAAARAAGEPTTNDRLTEKVVAEIIRAGGQADLVIDALYLAHDASPPDYAPGIRRLLAPGGVAAIEFDHLLPVIEEGQYDGFRHGHASYLSLHALARLFERFGLTVVEALRTPAYGGSLRIYVRRAEEVARADETIGDVLAAEALAGPTGTETYRAFARRVDQARSAPREFLDECRRDGRTVAAYGAPSRQHAPQLHRGQGLRHPVRGRSFAQQSGMLPSWLPDTNRRPRSPGRCSAGLPAHPHVGSARRDPPPDGSHPRMGRALRRSPAMTMFIGQLALVTGGGQGIGRAIAVAGASVIIVGRRPDPVADAVALIRGAGGSADGLALDRVKTEDRATLVADIDGRSAGPDVLVHSVGTIARVGGQALPARAPLAARGHRLDRLGPRSIRPARPRSPS
jgi:hypothetical protein